MQTVVVGVDGSERAERAARQAAEIARRFDAQLIVVFALARRTQQEVRSGSEAWQVNSLDRAEAVLQDLCTRLDARTKPVVANGRPAQVLLDVATEAAADLIVVGNKRMQGPSRILGPVAKDVAQHARCGVLIADTDERHSTR